MNKSNSVISEIESKIGYVFKNKELLITAITHSSYANQKKDIQYNERLEFLGDAVLQLCITEYLYKSYSKKSEGEMTKIRSLIVCENSLHEIAVKWDIGVYLRMSKGEELTGGRNRTSILADSIEAIIAAIYLDIGLENTREFILENFKVIILKAIRNEIILDYKTKLQEVIQKNGTADIKYDLVKYEGPPHRRKFYIKLLIDNETFGNGIGYSKKEAEQDAAKQGLKELEKRHE